MIRRLPLLTILLVLALASCSDSDQESSPSTTAPEVPTTTAVTTSGAASSSTTTTTVVAATYESAVMPPASYAEVAADYEPSRDRVFELGKLTLDQFLSEDFETLSDRLNAEMTNLVSVTDLQAGRDQLEATAPIGELSFERGVPLAPENHVYAAEIGWGDGSLALTASFDEADEISGLFLSPVADLPADPVADYESAVPYRLPFEGLWFTFWGGDTVIENYHAATASQRHAFDFIVWQNGSSHDGDGSELEQYWAYGQKVLAPAAGTVVTVVDGLPDQVPQIGSDPANPAGNHIVIEVDPGEYVLIAHMQPNSINVAVGDSVESGQAIGLVGNSGNTTEPHIHIHLQDSAEFAAGAVGLPLVFTDYAANGVAVERDQPVADQFVVNR